LGKQLITFEGWDGKWWRRIKVGKAVYDAATFLLPIKWTLAVWGLEEVVKAAKKRRTR
jgi:hypothetical protein